MRSIAQLSRLRLAAMLAAAAACVPACSTLDETASSLLASKANAAGVFAGRVLQGSASFTHAHEATMTLRSDDMPALACVGTLRFSATASGVTVFSCSDGQTVSIPFQSLSPLRGSGRTQIGGAVFALTYGMEPDMAAAYLGLPTERLAPPAKSAAAAATPKVTE